MCGSKQRSYMTFEKLSTNYPQQNAETAYKAKLDLKTAISEDGIKGNTQFVIKTTASDAATSSCQTRGQNEHIHELADKKISHEFTCPTQTFSICRWPASCTPTVRTESHSAVSVRGSREEGCSMFSKTGNLTGGRKRSGTDEGAGCSGQKRRKSADSSKQWESMDVSYQRLPPPFCNNQPEVLQQPHRHFREQTSAFPPSIGPTNSHLLRNNSELSAGLSYRTNNRRQWREDVIEYTDLNSQLIKQDIGVFHRVMQKLLLKCIDLQETHYNIYIPSWTDPAIRIYSTACDRYRADNDNTTVCSAAVKSCQSKRDGCEKGTQEPTHNCGADSSLEQLEDEATVRIYRGQEKVRSQIQMMKLSWQNLPTKYHQRLEVSHCFILVLDKHLRVKFVSKNVSRHLGYQQDDMLGRSIGQFIHPKQMSDLSRLTRGRQFQADDKRCFPLWKTGKMIAVPMKFSLRKTRTGVHDTCYTQVLWTVNLRLKERGQCVRAQDMVILCKPLHECTVPGLQMGGQILIHQCDLNCNFSFCNISHEIAERILHQKAKNLAGIKCLCFGIEHALLYVNHGKSNNMKTISHNCLRGTDSDLILNQLLQSCPLNVQVCSSCISKLWTTMGEISNNNHHCGAAVHPNASLALLPFKCVCKNHEIRKLFNNNFNPAWRVPIIDKMCSFSTAYNHSLIKASNSLHHKDVHLQFGKEMFDSNYGKSLTPDLECNQKCFSPLTLQFQKSISSSNLTQAPPFSDISLHHLMKASICPENIPSDELVPDRSNISDDTKSIFQAVTNIELTEVPAVSEHESNAHTSVYESFNYKCTQNAAQITTGSKQPDRLLPTSLQLPLDFKEESGLQLLSCQCQSDAITNCNLSGHVSSDICNKLEPSHLSSVVEIENISPLLVRQKISEDTLIDTCPTVSNINSSVGTNDTIRKKSNTLLHNILLDLPNTSVCNSSTLLDNVSSSTHIAQSKSSDDHRQASSAFNTSYPPVCSWSSVTSQMPSASTTTSAGDNNPANSTHSLDKVSSNNKYISLTTESSVEQTGYMNKVHGVSSKMTTQTSDPFLSQASFSDFNSLPGTDMFDDLASVTCPVTSPLLSHMTSQIEPGADQDTHSHLKDHFSSSSFQTFLDPAPECASFASEGLSDLDSLLNTIPVSHVGNSQSSLFSGWPESDTSQSSDSLSFSNSFFNKETSSRPSLLRKLLNKEGTVTQESENEGVCIIDQISKKISNVKKPKMHSGATKLQYSVCRQGKNNKNKLRRSVELPKMRLNQRQILLLNKHKSQFQKPTKELPLPSTKELPLPLSIKAAGTSSGSVVLQEDAIANGIAGPENNLDEEMKMSDELGSSYNSENYELPDDLIDMAVECCAPLETDETEALISDLNDSCSWEDNLYSLLESSGPENTDIDSGTESPLQTSEMMVTSNNPVMTYELLSNFLRSKDTFSRTQSESSTRGESSFLYNRKPTKEKPISSSCQASLPSHGRIKSPELTTTNACNSNVPTVSTTNCTNTVGKMSLLRAAITSDVDKLIEQIPLRKARKTMCTLHRTSEEREDDPDILITKVTGLKEGHGLSSSSHKLHRMISKVIPANTTRLSETISQCKPSQSSKTTLTISGHGRSLPSVQTLTTSVPANRCDKWQLLQNGSSCQHCGNTPNTPPIINPLVIKISIGSSSAPKIIRANTGSQNNLSQHLKEDSQMKVCDKSSSPSFSRATKCSSTDLSSTQPVSVMIMRKENHRSRRSKSIAIQTDNEPGEVYPEFEHSSSDTILYPSTIISYPSAVTSPYAISPLSTPLTMPLSSQSSLSETDKFLPSQPSADDSSSSADDDYRTLSSTPFLWKLLTGELSKDHYQRLDQQMLEKERKTSLQ